jgi:hypothetical protein
VANLIPIPGSASVRHLHENLAGTRVRLDDRVILVISQL